MTPDPRFKRVLDRLCELMPSLEKKPAEMIKAINLTNVWLQIGCDPDLDILPAINRKWARTPNGIKVFSAFYFDAVVREAMENRTGAEAFKKREAELLAQGYAWKRERGLFLAPAKLKYLEDYEAVHGPIIIQQLQREEA